MNIVHKLDILVVDDDVEILAMLAKLIEMEVIGSKVNALTCPIEALDALKFNHYDLVISDEKMPKLSGTELLCLADKLFASYTPFIFYTGSIDLVKPHKITSNHFYAIIEKPLHLELIKTIKAAINDQKNEVKNF